MEAFKRYCPKCRERTIHTVFVPQCQVCFQINPPEFQEKVVPTPVADQPRV